MPADAAENVAYTSAGGLPYRLALKIDCPVMLTVNMDKPGGLTNGARGFVTDIDERNHIVWVKFPGKIGAKLAAIHRRQYKYKGTSGAVAIKQRNASFPLRKNGNVTVTRTQFPLVVAYAITSHKAQGLTLDEVIIDFRSTATGKKGTGAACFYVAVTRVKKLCNLYLKSFDRRMISCTPVVEREMIRLRKHPYTFYKEPINKTDDNLNIVFLNINGLMRADHLTDLDNDINIKNADIVCLAETWLTNDHSNDDINLRGFSLHTRVDGCETSTLGMVIYVRDDSKFQPIDSCHIVNETNRQCILINVRGHSVVFAYVHPHDAYSYLRFVCDHCEPNCNQIFIGDLNVDYFSPEGRKLLQRLCQLTGKSISNHGPTRQSSLIDHVLLPNSYTYPLDYVVTAYYNFYSDHRAICLTLFSHDEDVDYHMDSDTDIMSDSE